MDSFQGMDVPYGVWRPILHLALLVAGSLGCSSSATGAVSRHQRAYALATCTDSVTCCLQRNPGVPEACGLTASEAASHLAGVKMSMEAVEEASTEWDDSHNAALPEWKRRCIRAYGDCQEDGWKGHCYACFRECEGQQRWPADKCYPTGR